MNLLWLGDTGMRSDRSPGAEPLQGCRGQEEAEVRGLLPLRPDDTLTQPHRPPSLAPCGQPLTAPELAQPLGQQAPELPLNHALGGSASSSPLGVESLFPVGEQALVV